MIVESAQMLSTAHRLLDGVDDDVLYKVAHKHHPSTKWTMQSFQNYAWHYKLFVALCAEYTHRYRKIHLTYRKLGKKLQIAPRNIPNTELTPFALAMKSNPECMDPTDPVASYRAFYLTKKDRFKMAWTSRPIPDWFV